MKRRYFLGMIIFCAFFFVVGGCMPMTDVKLVAFGDSSVKLYAPHLAPAFGVDTKMIGNEGESGEESDDGLERLKEYVRWGKYPHANTFVYQEGGGDIVDWVGNRDPLLLFSPNDAAYPFKFELLDKLSEMKQNVADAVLLTQEQGWKTFMTTYARFMPGIECTSLPFNMATEQQAARANEYRAKINDALREAAMLTGAILVDTGENPLLNDVQMFENCNHLNEQGNEIVAQDVAEAVIEVAYEIEIIEVE